MKKTLFTLSLAAVAALSFQSCKKEGCTDATANNYNAEAKKDDGTCLYGSDENKDLVTIESIDGEKNDKGDIPTWTKVIIKDTIVGQS